MQNIILTNDATSELKSLIATSGSDKVFALYDENTFRHCRPLLANLYGEVSITDIIIPPTDAAKNTDTLASVWEALQKKGASRSSLMLCIGGGMVTDLGGFAAATFKRGINFINVPTTLLAMVDAAVGGKTGINFGSLKNEIGVFREASAVVCDTNFLYTLDAENTNSGFAEMLKHALLSSKEMWSRHISFNLINPDFRALLPMVGESIEVKKNIVAQDPQEHGLRKALNLGHTFGHAMETLALKRSNTGLHGYFVAWGLVCELYLSCVLEKFPSNAMRKTVQYILSNYGKPNITCKDYEELYDLMLHDKKNSGGVISCTLLAEIGDIRIDRHPTKDDIFEAFDFLREA